MNAKCADSIIGVPKLMAELYPIHAPEGLTLMAVTLKAPMTSECPINDAIITPFAFNLSHRMPNTQGPRPALGNKTVYEGL